jgi:hypothetical protein
MGQFCLINAETIWHNFAADFSVYVSIETAAAIVRNKVHLYSSACFAFFNNFSA